MVVIRRGMFRTLVVLALAVTTTAAAGPALERRLAEAALRDAISRARDWPSRCAATCRKEWPRALAKGVGRTEPFDPFYGSTTLEIAYERYCQHDEPGLDETDHAGEPNVTRACGPRVLPARTGSPIAAVLRRLVAHLERRTNEPCARLLDDLRLLGAPADTQVRYRYRDLGKPGMIVETRAASLRELHLACARDARTGAERQLQSVISYAAKYPTVWTEPCREHWKHALAKGARPTRPFDGTDVVVVSEAMSIEDAYQRYCAVSSPS